MRGVSRRLMSFLENLSLNDHDDDDRSGVRVMRVDDQNDARYHFKYALAKCVNTAAIFELLKHKYCRKPSHMLYLCNRQIQN